MTKILLVEDDKSLREIYGVRLLAEGYDIVSAGDGEEALAMAIKERPALIVSDVMMPKISGFDMLDILRSTTETKDIKVIMMTALSSDDQRQRGEKLGADRYLVKSQVGIEDVVRTVHEVLGDLPGMNSEQHASSTQQNPFAGPPSRQPAAGYATQPSQQQDLPQPTAPFATQNSRPANLGDRVIQPLQASQSRPAEDVARLMEQELTGSTASQQPQPQAPIQQPAPQPQAPSANAQQLAAPQQDPYARPDVNSLSPQPRDPSAPPHMAPPTPANPSMNPVAHPGAGAPSMPSAPPSDPNQPTA